MNIITISIISLAVIGAVSALILYVISQYFKVDEDPRIDEVEKMLPGANCGGCGKSGCRNFAESCVKATSLEGMLCPVGGNKVMKEIAALLGREAHEAESRVAVVRCNGSCQHRPRTNSYEGAHNCAIAHTLYAGNTGCAYGCLGCGDCVSVCSLGAISIDAATGLPVVDIDICGGCGACARACPRNIIEVRKKGHNGRGVYVSCVNKDKGGVARKSCDVACIGCGKYAKECKCDAITIANNLSYIDSDKCKMCRKCVDVCPTGAIIAVNFPPKKAVEVTAVEDKPQQ
jgi:Na+-translocating ferredoxin:NAD+ oxidoreductase RNF subunit RnfB